MHVRDQDLDLLVGAGEAFEAFLHDLIRTETWACGIRQDQIDWDYRTSVGDGGRDVLIRVGNPHQQRMQFIPPHPSIWSAKSGKDGLDPSTLRAEIRTHPKVIQHLRQGGTYCWCAVAPADNDDSRDKLRQVARELAVELGFAADRICFFFRDSLTAWLKLHPGLVPIHLNLKMRWNTLDEWRGLFRTRWVAFGNRADLVNTICQHLLSTGDTNVLHLAGLSGIGKTRTALEACLSNSQLSDVLYFPNVESFGDVELGLIRSEGSCATVVIDEVTLADWDRLTTRLADHSHRIRMLTIGPAARGRVTAREGVLEVPPPDGQDEVIQVIQAADPDLSTDSARDIAGWCDHDLRLALLLVQANRSDPGLRNQPISSVEDVWDRITRLFTIEVADTASFRDYYSIVSLCIDVGSQDKYRAELQYLASHFDKPETDFDDFIARACDCGLGGQHGSFFEAGPRALSRRVFERHGWRRIKPTVSQFLRDMPTSRMQKRFLERGQECSQQVREEVVSALAEWFRSQFPSPDITLVRERQSSRVFSAYSEMNPEGGLRWLRQAVEQASSQTLLSLDGNPDGSGGWRGRRQVVWLCEHLACFPEHFWDCEAVLYRLALHETEKGIGNNSRNIWQQLFRPLFSGTAVPYELRLELLIERLSTSRTDETPLIMEAASEMLDSHPVGISPPRVVGGQLVPEEWRPNSYGELYEVQLLGARKVLEVLGTLPLDQLHIARTKVIGEIADFLRVGCLAELQVLLVPQQLNDADLRLLRLRLDEQISLLRMYDDDQKPWAKSALTQVIEWRQLFEPTTLESEVMEVTGRGYWEHGDRRKLDDGKSVYPELAMKVLDELGVLDRLTEWFNGTEHQSAFLFGHAIGELDLELAASQRMLSQLMQGRCLELIAGYFSGVSDRLKGLPEEFKGPVDQVGNLHPHYACYLTVHADPSQEGIQRLLRCLPHAPPNSSHVLFELIRGPWPAILSDQNKVDFVRTLLIRNDNGDPSAIQMALDLVSSWERHRTEALLPSYIEAILTVLEKCLTVKHPFQAYDWQLVVKLIPHSHVDSKSEILVRTLVGDGDIRWGLSRDALEALIETAGRFPNTVMKALGKRMLDQERGFVFRLSSFPGLFEAIGLDTVQRWLVGAGLQGAIAVARHLQSPSPTDSDLAYVPPLTEWFLTHFENEEQVFREFCAGRHAFEVRWGPARSYHKDIAARMDPYLQHPLRRVREWAKYELASAKHEIEWDERHSEELDRE